LNEFRLIVGACENLTLTGILYNTRVGTFEIHYGCGDGAELGAYGDGNGDGREWEDDERRGYNPTYESDRGNGYPMHLNMDGSGKGCLSGTGQYDDF
jgi:hypothetical protein